METWKRVARGRYFARHQYPARRAGRRGRLPYDLQGEICATQDRCPHGNASLADGYLEDGTIECPLHQGVFDIRSGKPKCPPVTTDLRRYEVKVDGDVIYLKAEAA